MIKIHQLLAWTRTKHYSASWRRLVSFYCEKCNLVFCLSKIGEAILWKFIVCGITGIYFRIKIWKLCLNLIHRVRKRYCLVCTRYTFFFMGKNLKNFLRFFKSKKKDCKIFWFKFVEIFRKNKKVYYLKYLPILTYFKYYIFMWDCS